LAARQDNEDENPQDEKQIKNDGRQPVGIWRYDEAQIFLIEHLCCQIEPDDVDGKNASSVAKYNFV